MVTKIDKTQNWLPQLESGQLKTFYKSKNSCNLIIAVFFVFPRFIVSSKN